MPAHPTPSARARELVAGAYDTHIHLAPEVMARSVDDLSPARRFQEVGLGGFMLKSHYAPIAERAAVVPGFAALGAITLNRRWAG